MTIAKQNVGIMLFDDVEVLDFAGPYEVFSRTRLEAGTESRRSYESAPFRVFTVASTNDPIRAASNYIHTSITTVPTASATAPR